MYLQNKYTRVYDLIVTRAQSRTLSTYTESHHIIPKSLGGSNDASNLVDLTPREHFICHRLLVKMTEGIAKRKMAYGLWAMTMANKKQDRIVINSRLFEKIRTDRIAAQIGVPHSRERIEKIRASNTGKIQSEATKRKRAEARTGFKNTDATKQKMKESAAKRWANTADDTARRQKIKEARALQKIVTVQVTCPHCGKVGGNRIMPRYHFDNCKVKDACR